jgi:hypothetical protein
MSVLTCTLAGLMAIPALAQSRRGTPDIVTQDERQGDYYRQQNTQDSSERYQSDRQRRSQRNQYDANRDWNRQRNRSNQDWSQRQQGNQYDYNRDWDRQRNQYDQGRFQRESGEQRSRYQQSGRQRQADRRSVSGKVKSSREFSIQGRRQPHLLAKIETQQGKTVVIDLGPAQRLSQQNREVSEGDQVRARGESGRINGYPVLIVDRLVGDNQVTVIRSTMSQRDQQRRSTTRADRGQQQRGQMNRSYRQQQDHWQRQADQRQRNRVKMTGKLVDLRGVNVKGINEQHRLGLLELEDGRRVVVDFGADQNIGNDLKLNRNEKIIVEGRKGRVNDRPVIFAERIADIATIDRTGQRQQQTQQQGQQRMSQRTD